MEKDDDSGNRGNRRTADPSGGRGEGGGAFADGPQLSGMDGRVCRWAGPFL